MDPAYPEGPQVRWAFRDATLRLVEETVDGQGRPLWLPNIIGGAPATGLQVPDVVDQAIPAIAAGDKCVYFGDLNRFIVRRVTYRTLKPLVVLYAE
ncbi:phage major capsid protein, partial [Klebsiella pneumoniae]